MQIRLAFFPHYKEILSKISLQGKLFSLSLCFRESFGFIISDAVFFQKLLSCFSAFLTIISLNDKENDSLMVIALKYRIW